MLKLNKKYGRLTLLRSWREGDVTCRFTVCECGNFNLFKSKYQFKRKSCGCLVTESIKNMADSIRKDIGVSAFNEVYNTYKRSASLRGYTFDISAENFLELTAKNCFYCGSKPSNKMERDKRNGSFIYNGLDRVDNTLGYTINNVVPCCKICNGMKMDIQLDYFLEHVRKMIKHSENWHMS